jgi:para-nitrobenzyl esterase
MRSAKKPIDPSQRRQRRDAFTDAYDPDNSGDAERIIARLVTDTSISEPDRDLARLHAKHGNATYVYHFSYTPAAQRATMFGLPHGGEIAYVFNTPRAAPFDEEGKAVASAANKYWTQFAKTGDRFDKIGLGHMRMVLVL